MRRTRLKTCFAFALAASLVTHGQAAPAKIPALHGSVLNGDKVELPDALKGKVAVLVVSFSQGSREEVTAWGKRLAADYRDSSTVLYYEMPVLESVPRLLRGYVLKKIAESVPDRAKPRFLPVYDHEREWKSAAAFKNPDNAYILVVDGNGTVAGKFEGPPSDETYAQLKARIAATSSGYPAHP